LRFLDVVSIFATVIAFVEALVPPLISKPLTVRIAKDKGVREHV
jgi:hypothetical protein